MNRSPLRASEVDIRREIYVCVLGNSFVLDALLKFDKSLFCADFKSSCGVCLYCKSGKYEEENP